MITKTALKALRKEVMLGASLATAMESAKIERQDLSVYELKELELVQRHIDELVRVNTYVNVGMTLNKALARVDLSPTCYYVRSAQYKIPRATFPNRLGHRITTKSGKKRIVEAINLDRQAGTPVKPACKKNGITWNTYTRWCTQLKIDKREFNITNQPAKYHKPSQECVGGETGVKSSLAPPTSEIGNVEAGHTQGSGRSPLPLSADTVTQGAVKRVIDDVENGKHRLSVALVRHGVSREWFMWVLRRANRPLPVFKEPEKTPASSSQKRSMWHKTKMALWESIGTKDLIRVLFLIILALNGYQIKLIWDQGALSPALVSIAFSMFLAGSALSWLLMAEGRIDGNLAPKSQQNHIDALSTHE